MVNNNIMHISWLQLDNEEYRQVWLGILGEEKEQPQENSKLIYIIGGALLLWLLTRKEEK